MEPSQVVKEALQRFDPDTFVSAAGVAWRYFDRSAAFIWATSGALLAARRGYDVSGIFAIALVSSTGGGLLRDILLQRGPPLLLRTPAYIVIAALGTVLVWLLGRRVENRVLRRTVAVADAFGLGGFAVVGMQLSTAAGLSVPAVILVGVANAIGGSLLRSVLLLQIPEIFRPGELTALAAFLGCVLFVALTRGLSTAEPAAGAATVVLVACVRYASVRYQLKTRPLSGFEDPPQQGSS